MTSISITIENVRRLKNVGIEIGRGSRTVVVGRNNAGKTTLLDVCVRALWALPVPFDEGCRAFNISWYRREGEAFLRPKTTVTVGRDVLSAELCSDPQAVFQFVMAGQHAETQAARGNSTNSKLVLVSANVLSGQRSVGLVAHRPEASTLDLWNAEMRCASILKNGAEWQDPLAKQVPLVGRLPTHQVYALTNSLARAALGLVERTFYLAAARSPTFHPSHELVAFSQKNTTQMTSLLLSLHATSEADFKNVSVALSLIFPEVRQLRLRRHPNGVVPEVLFVDDRVEDVGNLGFGLQNALHLLTVCSLCPPDSVLFIDEPEKGLNQSCQRDLGSVLDSLRTDVRLVVATQSEALCRGFSADASVLLAEGSANTTSVSRLHIATDKTDLRRLAKAMGIDPIFLGEGGRIIYVEGVSDREVVEDWLRQLSLATEDRYEVVSLGGCGKLGEAFFKPILAAYSDRVFVLLDSDRSSASEHASPDIARLAAWLAVSNVAHYVLKKRELENYLGPDLIAEVAGINVASLRSAPGHEDWFDLKAAFQREKGFTYDERRLTIGAYKLKDRAAQRKLFLDETAAISDAMRSFLAAG